MDRQFWTKRWQAGQIGFHEGRVNRCLEQYWPQLDAAPHETVFVPLCGKAVDLDWLAGQGHRVIGVELSELACRAFFSERDIEPETSRKGDFTHLAHEGIELLCGDFFNLTRQHLGGAALFYDRAALIALPPDMRPRYCRHLAHLMGPESRGLLITLDYPEQTFSGPPFAVPDSEVHQHLKDHFDIERLHHAALGLEEALVQRGLEAATESVFLLRSG